MNLKKLLDRLDALCDRYPPIALLYDVVLVFLDRRVTRSAAELAYYLLLTIFPMIIMAVGILGLVPVDAEVILGALRAVIPAPAMDLLGDYMSYVLTNQGMGMFVAGLLTTLTAASAAFRGLVSISGEIYGRRAFRGIWSLVYSFLFSLLLVVMIYVSLLVVLTGGWFVRLIERLLPWAMLPDYWPVLRLALLFSVSLLFLMGLYRITSPRGAVRPPVLSGALVTSLLLTALGSVFSALISLSSRYSVVYGSLASVIILMLWLYLCGNIVVLGNVLNYVWWRHRRGLPVALILERKL